MVKVALNKTEEKVTEYCFSGDTYREVLDISSDFCDKLKQSYHYARFNPTYHDQEWISTIVIVDESDVFYGKIILITFLALIFTIVAFLTLNQ